MGGNLSPPRQAWPVEQCLCLAVWLSPPLRIGLACRAMPLPCSMALSSAQDRVACRAVPLPCRKALSFAQDRVACRAMPLPCSMALSFAQDRVACRAMPLPCSMALSFAQDRVVWQSNAFALQYGSLLCSG